VQQFPQIDTIYCYNRNLIRSLLISKFYWLLPLSIDKETP